jgi:Mor family transcriptional regulator
MSTHAKEERRAELLLSIISNVSQSLVKAGIPEDKAYDIAVQLSDDLRQDFGGELFYMPKGQDYDTLVKHHQIFKEFNGTNHAELSRKYKVSVTHLYRVLKKFQDIRQPQLF